MKIAVTRLTRYQVISTAIYAIGIQSWFQAAMGNMARAVILLLFALVFNAVREDRFAMEVRGFSA
jgi:hypothetical protein